MTKCLVLYCQECNRSNGYICEQCENGYSKSDNRICKLCNYDKIIKND